MRGRAYNRAVPRTDLRASLLRGAARAVVAAVVLAVVFAIAGAQLAVAVYAGLLGGALALPSALVESWAMKRSGARSILLLIPVVWGAAWVALALVYLQGIYGVGVFEAGSLEGGWSALEVELKRLATRDDDLVNMWTCLPEAVGLAGFAVGFVCAALVRPFAYHTTSAADRVYGWPAVLASCLSVYLATVAFASLVVAVTITVLDGGNVTAFILMVGAILLGVTSLPTSAALALAHLVGDRVTRPFLEAPPP